jgi:hypothetical protein
MIKSSAKYSIKKGVQNGVTGAISRGAGSLRWSTFAEFFSHPTKRTLVNFSFLGAREWNAVMFEFNDRLWSLAAHVFDRILITKPIRAFHGVKHVPTPIILAHISKRRRNPPLRRHSVGAGWKHFRNASGGQTFLRHPKSCTKSGTSGTYDDNVKLVIND